MRRVRLSTLAACGLVIGRYPAFRYDASGGGALGSAIPRADGQEDIHFPADQVQIPALNSRTTRFLGLPLPPGLAIEIHADQLDGRFDPQSNELELNFRARFRFLVWIAGRQAYRAPDLLVNACLSTGAVSSLRHHQQGRALDHGRGCLVGVALVQPSGASWLDRFLGLPDEALALLECRFSDEP